MSATTVLKRGKMELRCDRFLANGNPITVLAWYRQNEQGEWCQVNTADLFGVMGLEELRFTIVGLQKALEAWEQLHPNLAPPCHACGRANRQEPDSAVGNGTPTVSEPGSSAAPIDGRKLTYGFLGLPFYKRLSVMKRVGFPPEVCSTESDNDFNIRFFTWVRENQLVERLWDEIEKERAQ